MHVGDTAVQRILDRDDRAIGLAIAHRIERIGEVETGQGQAIRERLKGRDMRIGAGGALKSDGAFGVRRGFLYHARDDRARGGCEIAPWRGALTGAFSSLAQAPACGDAPPNLRSRLSDREQPGNG